MSILYKRGSICLVLIFTIWMTGCRSTSQSAAEITAIKSDLVVLSVSSSAFRDGETIPVKYTCDADNTSPDINWSNIPTGSKSLILIVDDPDAPSGTWVHWVLINIPVDRSGLPEGINGSDLSNIGVQGKNSSGKTGYTGPCPPKGNPHRYYFKVYALDTTLNLQTGVKKADVEKSMEGHIIAQGQLMGTYGR